MALLTHGEAGTDADDTYKTKRRDETIETDDGRDTIQFDSRAAGEKTLVDLDLKSRAGEIDWDTMVFRLNNKKIDLGGDLTGGFFYGTEIETRKKGAQATVESEADFAELIYAALRLGDERVTAEGPKGLGDLKLDIGTTGRDNRDIELVFSGSSQVDSDVQEALAGNDRDTAENTFEVIKLGDKSDKNTIKVNDPDIFVFISGFDVNGGGKSSFDKLKLGNAFGAFKGTYSKTGQFLDLVEDLENDGNEATDARVVGDDLILDFGVGGEDEGEFTEFEGGRIYLLDVVGNDGLTYEALADVGADIFTG